MPFVLRGLTLLDLTQLVGSGGGQKSFPAEQTFLQAEPSIATKLRIRRLHDTAATMCVHPSYPPYSAPWGAQLSLCRGHFQATPGLLAQHSCRDGNILSAAQHGACLPSQVTLLLGSSQHHSPACSCKVWLPASSIADIAMLYRWARQDMVHEMRAGCRAGGLAEPAGAAQMAVAQPVGADLGRPSDGAPPARCRRLPPPPAPGSSAGCCASCALRKCSRCPR